MGPGTKVGYDPALISEELHVKWKGAGTTAICMMYYTDICSRGIHFVTHPSIKKFNLINN